MSKKLYKSRTDTKIDGVCGGIAKYLGIDATIIRLLWVLLAFTGSGILAYIVCAIVIPREPDVYDDYDNYNDSNRPMQ